LVEIAESALLARSLLATAVDEKQLLLEFIQLPPLVGAFWCMKWLSWWSLPRLLLKWYRMLAHTFQRSTIGAGPWPEFCIRAWGSNVIDAKSARLTLDKMFISVLYIKCGSLLTRSCWRGTFILSKCCFLHSTCTGKMWLLLKVATRLPATEF